MKIGYAFAAAAVAAAFSVCTSAQSTNTTEPAGAPQLESVVVTADRMGFSKDFVSVGTFRGARVMDTPQTIAVIPKEVMESQEALSIGDALRNTSGVTQSQVSEAVYSNLAIRGIVVDNRVNFRLDGFLPVLALMDEPLEDKDRIEALKGAAGLYYGFATPGGIINFTMKRPTDDRQTRVTVNGSNHGNAGIAVDTGETIGKFGYRINGYFGRVDSGIDNTGAQRSLLAGAFDFKPLDNLTFKLDLEHIYKFVGAEPAPLFLTSASLPASTIANPYPKIMLPRPNPNTVNFAPDWASNRAEETNGIFGGDWRINSAWDFSVELGASTLSRIRHLSYLEPKNLLPLTVGYQPATTGTLTMTYQPAHYLNQAIRAQLAGVFDTFFLTHNVLIGASENKRDSHQPSPAPAAGNGPTSFVYGGPTPATATPSMTVTGTPYASSDPAIAEPNFIAGTFTRSRVDDKGAYVYDRVSYDDLIQVSGGVRSIDYIETNLTTNARTYEARPTLYSGSVVVTPKRWISVYASYLEGLTTTNGTPTNVVNFGQQLPPTASTQREAGIKVQPRNGLLASVAYFDVKQGAPYTNANNEFVLGGNAEYKGWEFDVSGEITDELSVFASGMTLSAKNITGAPTCGPGTPIGTLNGGCKSFTPTVVGLWVSGAPRASYSFAAEYRLDRWVKRLAITAATYYTGRQRVDARNTAVIPGFETVDLGMSYATNLFEVPTTFRINGQNILNKGGYMATSGGFLSQGAPASVKFSVAANF